MNNKILLVILVLAAAGYFVVQWANQGEGRTFRSNLTDLDTAEVDKLRIQQANQEAFEVALIDGRWMVKKKESSLPADEQAVRSVLATMQNLKVEAIVAKKQDRWSEYELDKARATRVEIFSDGEQRNDLYLGKFKFNKQSRSATSYVRSAEESTVYSVDGMISMAFKQGASYFYNKSVMDISPDEMTGMEYNHGSDSYRIERRNESWYQNGTPIDSAEAAEYIQKFSPLKSYSVANIDRQGWKEIPGTKHRLVISKRNGNSESLEAVFNDQTGKFIIHSSQFPEMYYASDSSAMYKRVFSSFPGSAAGTE